MSAQPVHEGPDPRNPLVILRTLPEEAREAFRAQYQQAVHEAYDPEGYVALQEMLIHWGVLAQAYAKPDFRLRYEDVRAGDGQYLPVDEVLPHRPA